MPQSPRLLRPANNFTPKSITGLALWLDASDASTLFQDAAATTPATATNDPVGAWLDKSGNARHATQSTAGLRGLVLASAGRTRVDIPSTANAGFVIANSPTTSSSATIIQVARFAGNPHFLTLMRGDTNAFFDAAESGSAASPASVAGSPSYFVQGVGITATRGSLYAALNNTTAVFSATNVNTSTWSSGWRGYNYGTSYQFTGEVAEALVYSRSISSLERQRLERYLAAKWGITLAPQVSNADAQDWINRVYANGGSVTSSTAAAVNTLCIDLENASLRDRFYRLNLFCGTGLNAALVPLYRGPSLGGTQYGNTTDTNVGPFVSGDYAETGASGGLVGNGSTKRLGTGVLGSTLAGHNFHVSSYEIVGSGTSYDTSLGCWTSTGGQGFYFGTQGSSSAYGIEYPGNNLTYTPAAVTGHFVAVQTGSKQGAIYRNGSVGATAYFSSAETTNSWSGLTWDVAVFAGQKTAAGTYGEYSAARLGGYSFGLAMTAPQAAAYYTAMQAFQTALGRNV